jgi:hypothetical protein
MIIVLFQQNCPCVEPRLLYRLFIGLEASSKSTIMPTATSNEIQVLFVCLGRYREHGDPRFRHYVLVRSKEGQRMVRMTVELILKMTSSEGQPPWEKLRNDSDPLIFIMIRTRRAACVCIQMRREIRIWEITKFTCDAVRDFLRVSSTLNVLN